MKVRTGVIAAAGSGTRMYPVTIGYPKELLPIINKPAIHLIVEEFIDSGISKIVIVTGANPEPLRRQYDPSVLAKVADHSNVREFAKKLAGVEVLFEPQQGPYGNGTPLLVARSHIPADEGFIYAYGDDLVKSESPFARRLIDAHNRSGALVVATQEVPREEVVRYGMAKIEEKDGNMELLDVVEKPLLAEVTSNLVMFGRFLLSHRIIDILSSLPLGKSNELWLTDSVREYVRSGGRVVVESVTGGKWLTIGDPVNYLTTLMEYVLEQPELRAALAPRIRELLDNA